MSQRDFHDREELTWWLNTTLRQLGDEIKIPSSDIKNYKTIEELFNQAEIRLGYLDLFECASIILQNQAIRNTVLFEGDEKELSSLRGIFQLLWQISEKILEQLPWPWSEEIKTCINYNELRHDHIVKIFKDKLRQTF